MTKHHMRKRVLSGEVELVYVLTDRQTADIFTKPLGLDKLRQFSGALDLQHLDMPKFRGRRRTKSNEEFNFDTAEEAEDGYGGCD